MKSIIKAAIAESCSAGAELLVWACSNNGISMEINCSLTEKWLFYRAAILNPFIVPDEIPSDGEGDGVEIHWNFIFELQSFRKSDCSDLLEAWKKRFDSDFLSDNVNRKAVDKLKTLFEQLNAFKSALIPWSMFRVEYRAKYEIISRGNEESRKTIRQDIIDSLESNDSMYGSGE